MVPPPESAPSVTPAATLERGQTIGRFVVLGLVGRGGMGEVYAAYDPELERKVAVKLLRPRTSSSVDGRGRLLREAQAIAKLSHPNVVVVYDVGTHRDGVFIAMEFVEGHTVTGWLAVQRRSWREILKVFQAAGRGLAAAHEADLVHRDFKPENVMVTRDGQVRVMDFGLARRVLDPRRRTSSHEMAAAAASQVIEMGLSDPDLIATQPLGELAEAATSSSSDSLASRLTQTGARVGTPAYMAPEQFAGAFSDARTDQFSFCVALYEALYGERPFSGDDIMALMTSVMTGAVREPPASARVPAWIRRILMRGLRTPPAERFSSMGALLDALASDPGAHRRKWITIGAGLAGMVVIAVAAQRIGSGQRTLCAGGGAHLDGIWEPGGAPTPRKAAIRRAFLGTGKSYAVQAYGGTSRLLDEYVGRWVEMYTDACVATQVRGEQSQEVLDLRMACLQQRAANVRALTDVFQHADAAVVDNAVSAAGALPALDRCADAALLRAVVKPPDDPEKRRRVTAEREDLAQLIALRDSGQCAAADAKAAELVAAVRGTQYLPLLADALNAVAYLGDTCGDATRSIELYKEAYAAAVQSRHDLAAAEAAAIMPTLAENRAHDHQMAKDWVRIGRATLERIGGNPLIEAWLTVSEGMVLTADGRFGAALEAQRRAFAIKEKVLGPDHPETLLSLANVGLALQEAGDYPQALEVDRRVMAALERTLGRDHPRVSLIGNNLGEVLNALGRTAEARPVFERAVATLRRAGTDPSLIAYSLTGLGIADLAEGRGGEAVPILEEALRIRSEKHADALHLGEVRFALARALAQRPAMRAHALTLAGDARADYAGAHDARGLAAVEAWLSQQAR